MRRIQQQEQHYRYIGLSLLLVSCIFFVIVTIKYMHSWGAMEAGDGTARRADSPFVTNKIKNRNGPAVRPKPRCQHILRIIELARCVIDFFMPFIPRTQEDIGVSSPFQCDLSDAVGCLAELSRCPTPMDKMLQIKARINLDKPLQNASSWSRGSSKGVRVSRAKNKK